MDSKTSNVGPAAVEGVGFLPARERWDQTSYAVASYRDLTCGPTAKTCSRSCAAAPNGNSPCWRRSDRT